MATKCCARNIVLDQILNIIPSASCPTACLTINDLGDLPDPAVCDFVYYSPLNQQQAAYYVYNTGLVQWDAVYSVISTDQSGDDFTQISIDLLSGWSLSVDGGSTWIDTAGVHAINVPAPMVITVRNDSNGCTYVGQTLELEYTIWFATFDNGGSWPMNFDCGSYGIGFAADNGEYATFLQTNVTPESGSGFFGTVVTLWITLLKGEAAPVDWTYGAGPATPINFAQQTTGRKIFGCLQASYTVADASLWNPYLLTDAAFGLQGEVIGTLPYDDPSTEAILSTVVTNMYGATASSTLDVVGNDVVFTITNTMLLPEGTIDSTEDFVTLQPDTYSEIECP